MKPTVLKKPLENKPKSEPLLLGELGVGAQACNPSTQDSKGG